MKCTNCGSENTILRDNRQRHAAIIMIVGGILTSWMIIGIPLLIAGVGFLIKISSKPDHDTFICKSCSKVFISN